MTTFTFLANSSNQNVDWSSPSIWSGGVVPNDPSADVVIPEITVVATGQPYASTIAINGSYTINSLSISDNGLWVETGGLTVDGAVDVQTGAAIRVDATLTAGSLTNDGSLYGGGTLAISGSLVNDSSMQAVGLTVTAASFSNTGALTGAGDLTLNVAPDGFSNTGALTANGDLTLSVTPGGFANFSDSTLTGGTYNVSANDVLNLNIGGVLSTLAANVTLYAGSEIQSYDDALGAYRTIESTLTDVAAGGKLTLLEPGVADRWGDLTVDGQMMLDQLNATFAQLTVDAGGTVEGVGSISGPIVDNGTIIVSNPWGADDGVSGPMAPLPTGAAATLKIEGPVTGSGTLEIAKAAEWANGFGSTAFGPWTLELTQAASANVVFEDGRGGILQLDDPTEFTGTIKPMGGDLIQLPSILLNSVTGYSYSGDRSGGTLTIDLSDGSSLNLKFAGDYIASDFTLGAGPHVLSSDPTPLMITVNSTAAPTVDLIGDHFQGAGPSELLAENTAGAVVVGQISGGQEHYTTVSALGAGWTFEGTGDFLGDGQSQFLLENSSGGVYVGEVSNGAATLTQVSSLGPPWKVVATGDFFGDEGGTPLYPPAFLQGGDRDQFLVENTSGQLDLETVINGSAQVTGLPGPLLGAEWTVLGAGAYAGDGRTEFLLENTSGVVEIGTVISNSNGTAPPQYTSVAAVGSEWKYLGSGDILGDGTDEFVMENTSGVVSLGKLGANDQAQFTFVAAIGAEWSFIGAGDYLGEGHDQLMFRNTSGVLALGDYKNGQMQFTQVSAVGSEWTFHS